MARLPLSHPRPSQPRPRQQLHQSAPIITSERAAAKKANKALFRQRSFASAQPSSEDDLSSDDDPSSDDADPAAPQKCADRCGFWALAGVSEYCSKCKARREVAGDLSSDDNTSTDDSLTSDDDVEDSLPCPSATLKAVAPRAKVRASSAHQAARAFAAAEAEAATEAAEQWFLARLSDASVRAEDDGSPHDELLLKAPAAEANASVSTAIASVPQAQPPPPVRQRALGRMTMESDSSDSDSDDASSAPLELGKRSATLGDLRPATDVKQAKAEAGSKQPLVPLQRQMTEPSSPGLAAGAVPASDLRQTLASLATSIEVTLDTSAPALAPAESVQQNPSAMAIYADGEVLDADAFLRRFVAFRQYVEFVLKHLSPKAAKTKSWRMTIRRDALCGDVLEYFHDGSKVKLFQSTEVAFIESLTGLHEDGRDDGGLTAEMYSRFFREVLTADAGLFTGSNQRAGACTASVGLLPSPSAAPESMTALGRIMCKSALDDQPLGCGIGRFVFEYLADTHDTRVFKTAQSALAALADYDPEIARQWAALLARPITGLTRDMFDPNAKDDELPATAEAIGAAIIAGCRHRLLSSRQESLEALRKGFTEHVDLHYQLAALSSTELLRMMRGNTELSVDDLLGCFDWSTASTAEFEAIGSDVPAFLREIIEETSAATVLESEQRLHLLEWATALSALPCSGLKERVTLKLWPGADDSDLPNVHTCTHEVHLPAYTSRERMREKLLLAVAHRNDGFHIK